MKILNVINFVCTSFQPRHHSSETRSRRVLLLTGRIQGLPRTFGHSHHGHAPRWTWSGLYNPPYGTLRTLANISELSIIYKSQKNWRNKLNNHGGLIKWTDNFFGFNIECVLITFWLLIMINSSRKSVQDPFVSVRCNYLVVLFK